MEHLTNQLTAVGHDRRPSLAQSPELPFASDRGDQTAVTEVDGRIGAFVQLYRELFPPLFGFVRYRVSDRQAAEDITAQVFERALSRLATVRQPERVRSWLFSIARNLVADYRRQRPTTDLEVVEQLAHLWTDSPESEALRRDEIRRLAGHLATLGEREQELLGLRFAAGLRNRKIGQIVGFSEANVAQIIHRAIVKLRDRLAAEEVTR